MGYLPIAGPSGAVKTGPTYLLHRQAGASQWEQTPYLARSRNPVCASLGVLEGVDIFSSAALAGVGVPAPPHAPPPPPPPLEW